jgi:hypothetical protein
VFIFIPHLSLWLRMRGVMNCFFWGGGILAIATRHFSNPKYETSHKQNSSLRKCASPFDLLGKRKGKGGGARGEKFSGSG